MAGSAQPSSVAASLAYRPRREYHQRSVPEPCPATEHGLRYRWIDVRELLRELREARRAHVYVFVKMSGG